MGKFLLCKLVFWTSIGIRFCGQVFWASFVGMFVFFVSFVGELILWMSFVDEASWFCG